MSQDQGGLKLKTIDVKGGLISTRSPISRAGDDENTNYGGRLKSSSVGSIREPQEYGTADISWTEPWLHGNPMPANVPVIFLCRATQGSRFG